MMMLVFIKQHLSNIWTQFRTKLSNTEAELKMSVAYKKDVYFWQYILFYKHIAVMYILVRIH